MQEKFNIINFTLSALLVASLSVSGYAYYQISSVNKTISDLQTQITAKQSGLIKVRAAIEYKKSTIIDGVDTSDITDLPSVNDVSSEGIPLGVIQSAIIDTSKTLVTEGCTASELKSELESMATKLGTTLEVINSLPGSTAIAAPINAGSKPVGNDSTANNATTTPTSPSTPTTKPNTSTQNYNNSEVIRSQAEIDALEKEFGLTTSEDYIGSGTSQAGGNPFQTN